MDDSVQEDESFTEEEDLEDEGRKSNQSSLSKEGNTREPSFRVDQQTKRKEQEILKNSKKVVDDFFSLARASLPAKKPNLKEIKMLLPGHGPEKQTVVLRLSKARDWGLQSFARAYKDRTRRIIRDSMLQELKAKGEKEAIVRFLKAQMILSKANNADKDDIQNAEVEREGEDPSANLFSRASDTMGLKNTEAGEPSYNDTELAESVESSFDGSPGKGKELFPYWLPYLLSNDLFYLELVCETMFGWAVPPRLLESMAGEQSESYDSKNPPSLPILMVRDGKSGCETELSQRHRVSFIQTNGDDTNLNGGAQQSASDSGRVELCTAANDEEKSEYFYHNEDTEIETMNQTSRPFSEQEEEAHEGEYVPFTSSISSKNKEKNAEKAIDVWELSNAENREVSKKVSTSIGSLVFNQCQTFLKSANLSISQRKAKFTDQPFMSNSVHGEIVAFPHANYKLYVVWEMNAEQWVLLDAHPLIVQRRAREKLLKRTQESKPETSSEEQDTDVSSSNDEEEASVSEDEEETEIGENVRGPGGDGTHAEREETDESEEDDESEEEDVEDEEKIPSFDYESVIVLDALMLAALQAPSFLKVCFLQKAHRKSQRPAFSLEHVEEWLVVDEDAGFPILSSVYTALMNARRQYSVASLPHEPPTLHFDFNYFFQEKVLFRNPKSTSESNASASRRLLSNDSSLMIGQLDSLTNLRSKVTMESMRALLNANVVPSRPISLNMLSSPESLQLALWLLVCIPERLLYVWGEQARVKRLWSDSQNVRRGQTLTDDDNKSATKSHDEGEEEEEEEEEEEKGGSLYPGYSKKIQRIESARQASMQEKIWLLWHNVGPAPSPTAERNKASQRDARFPPALLPGPLLFSTVVEIRRRMARERLGRKPLSYPLTVDVEKFMDVQNLEDNSVDSLVTSSFRTYIEITRKGRDVRSMSQGLADSMIGFVDTKLLSSATRTSVTSQSISSSQMALEEEPSPTSVNPSTLFGIPRYQKIYQSDLVLLLLACTNTPTPRDIIALPPHRDNDSFENRNPTSPAVQSSPFRTLSMDAVSPRESTIVVLNRTQCPKMPNSESCTSFSSSRQFASIKRLMQPQSVPSVPSTPLTYHNIYFDSLLQAKIQRQGSRAGSSLPLAQARCGMWRLLFVLLPRFVDLQMIQGLCNIAPLYKLFGVNECCPLQELVYYWALEGSKRKDEFSCNFRRVHGTREHSFGLNQVVDTFVGAFWHELYHRLKAGLYPKNVLSFIQHCSSSAGRMLLSKVQDRMNMLRQEVSHLTGIQFSNAKATNLQCVDFAYELQEQNFRFLVESSRPGSTNITPIEDSDPLKKSIGAPNGSSFQGSCLDTKEKENDLLRKMVETTLLVSSVTNEPFRSATQRLVASLKTLPMTERNIFTPELLFELLFVEPKANNVCVGKINPNKTGSCEIQNRKKKKLNFVAIRYVVVEKHITTVREHGPFMSTEIPALEYAILHEYVDAAALLVSLGASLRDLIFNGSMTLESFLQRCWPAERANKLRQLWLLQTQLIRLDPEYQYGMLRPVL